MKISVFEDNNGALNLVKTQKMRPRTKHVDIKHPNFSNFIEKDMIILGPIDTSEHQSYFVTNSLANPSFVVFGLKSQDGNFNTWCPLFMQSFYPIINDQFQGEHHNVTSQFPRNLFIGRQAKETISFMSTMTIYWYTQGYNALLCLHESYLSAKLNCVSYFSFILCQITLLQCQLIKVIVNKAKLQI